MQGAVSQDVENSNVSEEVPDVSAAINVDDEIVRGTASVSLQQSVESHPMEYQSTSQNQGASSVIKVRHFINSEAGTSRAHNYGGNVSAGLDEPHLTADELGTYQAFQTPQTIGMESEFMTENTHRMSHNLNTVPIPHTVGNFIETDANSTTVRRAVVTRDGGEGEVYQSNELPYDIFTQPPGTPPDFEDIQQQQQRLQPQQQQQQRVFLVSEVAGSDACKEVIEQDEEDDEYSDDVDQASKSPGKSAARTKAQQQLQQEITKFEDFEPVEVDTPACASPTTGTAPAEKVSSTAVVQELAVLTELEKFIINLNHQAMAHLKTDQFSQAKRLLQKAEMNLNQVDRQCSELRANADSIGDLNDKSLQKKMEDVEELETLKNRLMGLTYNNFGCLCKQQKDFKGALDYLKRALDYESRLEDYSTEAQLQTSEATDEQEALQFEQDLKTTNCNSAGTILNICAILSKISKHAQAHEYAEEAVTKLQHSMRLTKVQASSAARRVDAAIERLDQAERAEKSKEEIQEFEQEVAQQEQQKIDLENQWINLATTAVIAHYNAAVELEFMSLWRESLLAYEKAARLASIAMKAQNPMSQKIAQAIFKMRMKVRNKVQLPDKRSLQAGEKVSTAASVGGKKRSQHGRSLFSNSKITSQMQGSLQQTNLKDWQTSVNSQKSSVQPEGSRTANTVVLNSDTFGPNNSDLQPALQSFYPEDSVLSSTQEHIIAQSAVNKRRQKDQQERKDANTSATAAPLNAMNDKSPLSLKKIIDKLQKTEKQEAKQYLQPKTKLRNAGRNFQTISSYCGSTDDDCFNSLQLVQPYPTIGGSAVPCSRTQRAAMNSAGTQSIDPNFLPSLNQQRGQTSFFSTRNGATRHSTMLGLRQSLSPLRDNGRAGKDSRRGQLLAPVGRRNKGRGGSMLPTTVPQAEHSRAMGGLFNEVEVPEKPLDMVKIYQLQVQREESVKRRMNSLGVGHLSPNRLQIQLLKAQERRLAEQSKRKYISTSKRDQEINQMLGPLINKPAIRTNKKPGVNDSIGPISADLAALKAQNFMSLNQKPTGANLACSAYLPKKLKNSIKQKHQTRAQEAAIKAHIKKARMNAQIETAFKKEMAAWKQARETGSFDTSSGGQLDANCSLKMPHKLDQTSQDRICIEAPMRQYRNNQGHERHDQVVSQQYEVLSAEQAQEARSIRNDSQAKLTDKQGAQEINSGPSRDVDEEEVGNCRLSPQSRATPQQPKHTPCAPKEMTFEKKRRSSNPDGNGDEDMSQIQDYNTNKAESQTYSLSNIVNAQQRDQNTTCQEILLDRVSLKASETLEVEDIVSADTTNNNIAGVIGGINTAGDGNRFQSYRSSSNAFYQTGEIAQRGQTPELENMARMNNDSGLKRLCANDPSHQQKTARAQGVSGVTSIDKIGSAPGKRSQNVKSSLAMTSGQKLEQFIGKNNHDNRGSVEVRAVEDRIAVVNSDHEEYAQYRELHKVSQNQGSSIIDSQQTETIQTNQSECGRIEKQIDTLHDSTIHEDTIDAWKREFAQNAEVIAPGATLVESQSPDLTDEIATVGDRNSMIGDGPIYIKKSTDYHLTTSRRIKYMGSQSSLEQTEFALNTTDARKKGNKMLIHDSATELQNDVSCKVSDNTQQTELRRYQNKMSQEQNIQAASYSIGSARGPSQATVANPSRDELMLHGHRNSEIMTAEYQSQLSQDQVCQGDDSVSQETEPVCANRTSQQIIGPAGVNQGGNQSGKIRVQDEQPPNGGTTTEDISSFMTPRPGLTNSLITRETVVESQSRRLERSSVDTEMQDGMPKHIQYSKQSKKPPASSHQRQSQINQKSVAGSFKIKTGSELLRQQRRDVARPTVQSGPNSAMPNSIHVTETGDTRSFAAPLTPLGGVTPEPLMGSSQGYDNGQAQQNPRFNSDIVLVQNDEVAAITRNTDGFQQIRSQHMTEVPQAASNTLRYSSGIVKEDAVQRGTPIVQTAKPFQTEDRVAKIAEQISKLNTNLLQFQSEIEESKKDPLLKSTHRSTASKKGLMSQKSREMCGAALSRVSDQQSLTDVILMPDHVTAMQDKRLADQLQSAPGRSRVRM